MCRALYAILEVSASLQKSWWEGFELTGAVIEAKGNVTVRRSDAVVMVLPVISHSGVPLLAVQYKEFWRKRPETKRLFEEIVEKLIALGAKRFERGTAKA